MGDDCECESKDFVNLYFCPSILDKGNLRCIMEHSDFLFELNAYKRALRCSFSSCKMYLITAWPTLLYFQSNALLHFHIHSEESKVSFLLMLTRKYINLGLACPEVSRFSGLCARSPTAGHPIGIHFTFVQIIVHNMIQLYPFTNPNRASTTSSNNASQQLMRHSLLCIMLNSMIQMFQLLISNPPQSAYQLRQLWS